MFWQRVRLVVLAGIAVVAAVRPAIAGDCCGAPACPAPCAPAYKTILVDQWVPEQYQSTRTVYKTECKTEAYTAYKTECVPETRTRCITVCKTVSEVQTCTRNVQVCVPCVEERTVMQAFTSCKPVTHMVKKCVDQGHWEERCVEVKPGICDRLIEKCKKHREGCCYCPPPVKTKLEKCWVPCKVWVECPVTVMERTCEYRPVSCKVTTYKTECRQEQYQVTVCKLVPEQKTETYTVLVSRCVPVQATRTVAVCVPVQESFTCTRMVCHKVEKQIPCAICCYTPCCDAPKCKKHCFSH